MLHFLSFEVTRLSTDTNKMAPLAILLLFACEIASAASFLSQNASAFCQYLNTALDVVTFTPNETNYESLRIKNW